MSGALRGPPLEASATVQMLQQVVEGMGEAEAAQILEALRSAAFEVITPPQVARVMMTVTDPFQTDFHLGEVLVTEAVVRVGACRGFGITTGDSPQRALLKAVLDAFDRAGEGPWVDRAAALLAPAHARRQEARSREEALVARTRVCFERLPVK